jgi:hypothetical protein
MVSDTEVLYIRSYHNPFMTPDVLVLIDSKLGLFALAIVALSAVFGLHGGVLLGLIEIYPEEKKRIYRDVYCKTERQSSL